MQEKIEQPTLALPLGRDGRDLDENTRPPVLGNVQTVIGYPTGERTTEVDEVAVARAPMTEFANTIAFDSAQAICAPKRGLNMVW